MWGQPDEPAPASPIVAAFAPDDFGAAYHDLADLFVVEYLIRRPELTNLQISRGAEMLRDSLHHQREERREATRRDSDTERVDDPGDKNPERGDER
jgi:hypothetical protein